MAKTEIIKDKFTTRLNLSIKNRNELDIDVYSFVEIVVNNFDLKPDIKFRMVWILKRLFNDYHNLINGISYENAVIGTMLFTMKESRLPCYGNVDVSYFLSCLYKEEDIKRNTIQIYNVTQVVEDLFSEHEHCISQSDEVKKGLIANC